MSFWLFSFLIFVFLPFSVAQPRFTSAYISFLLPFCPSLCLVPTLSVLSFYRIILPSFPLSLPLLLLTRLQLLPSSRPLFSFFFILVLSVHVIQYSAVCLSVCLSVCQPSLSLAVLLIPWHAGVSQIPNMALIVMPEIVYTDTLILRTLSLSEFSISIGIRLLFG